MSFIGVPFGDVGGRVASASGRAFALAAGELGGERVEVLVPERAEAVEPHVDLTAAARVDRRTAGREVPHGRCGALTGVVRDGVTVGQRTGNSARVGWQP